MKRKFFLKRLQYFLIAMSLPMLLVFILLISSTVKQIDGKLKSENQQTISSVETNLGQVIYGAKEQSKAMAANIRMSMALKHALVENEVMYTDILYLDSLQMALGSTVSAYTYLESSYLYLVGGDRVISSDKGLETIGAISDKGWLDVCNAVEEKEKSGIGVRILDEGKINEHNVLTVCHRLAVQNGYIVLNLNMEKLQEMIEHLKINEEEMVYLVDENGHILVASDNAEQNNDQIIPALFLRDKEEECILNLEEGWHRIGGQKMLIGMSEQTESQMQIVSLIPGSLFRKRMVEELHGWLLMLLGAVAIVVFLAYSVTSRSFAHINTILDMFDSASRGIPIAGHQGVPKDEYDVILDNIVRVFINSSYLQLQLQEQKFKQENAELMALQLQINPHFLYNTLQTLHMEARKIDATGKTSRIIEDVSDILKYALGSSQESVSLQEELDHLKKYVEVQNYRFGQFIVYYEVDEDVLDAEVFRLMLQPVVENSLLHGIRGLERQGYVKIWIKNKKGWLDIRVIDNGHGMSKEELEELRDRIEENKGSSIGLINLNRRLQLRYDSESKLKIQSKKDFCTCISFQIPYKKIV